MNGTGRLRRIKALEQSLGAGEATAEDYRRAQSLLDMFARLTIETPKRAEDLSPDEVKRLATPMTLQELSMRFCKSRREEIHREAAAVEARHTQRVPAGAEISSGWRTIIEE